MKTRRFTPFPSLLTTAGILFAGFVTISQADILYWDTNGATAGSASGNSGGGANGWGPHNVWSTSAAGDLATIGYTQGSDVVFSAGSNATDPSVIRLNGAQSANSLTFEEGTITLSSGDANGDFSNGGGSLSIGAGGITMTDGLDGNVIIAGGIGTLTLSDSQTWNNNTTTTARTLTVQTAIAGSAASGNTTTLTLSDTNTAANNLEGAITDGANGGALAITKNGNSSYSLNGGSANTYSGLTTVSGGTLALNKTDGIDAIAGDVLVTGGTLSWTLSNQIADTAAISASGGRLNFNNRGETIASLTLTGGRMDTGNQGSSNLVNITNAITMSGGAKLTVNSGGAVAAESVSLDGTRINIDAGSGGNILIGGNSTSVISALTVGAGGLSMTGQDIQFNNTSDTGLGSQIVLNGDLTASGTNRINYGANTGIQLSSIELGAADRTFNITADVTTIGVTVAGTGSLLNKDGNGTLELTASNTYTGLTSINGGAIRIYNNNALGTNAAGTEVAEGAALGLYNDITVTGESLKLVGVSFGAGNNAGLVNSSGNNVWAGDVTLDISNSNNVRILANAGTLDIQGNVFLDSGAASGNGTGLVITGDGGDATISGNITAAGNNQNLIKTGTGTWTLSGNNTYDGVTRVDIGTVSVNSIANNLGTSTGSISLGQGSNTGTLRYTGAGENVTRGFVLAGNSTGNGGIEQAGSGLLNISGNITSNTSTAGKTLTLTGSTAGTGEISGNIFDSSNSITGITKTGTGTWALTGAANTYTGATTVNGGTLIAASPINTSTSISVSNATFAFGANDVASDSATLALGDTAVLQMNGFSDALGVLAVSGNAELALAGGASIITFANSSSADWTGGMLSVTGWNGNIAGNGAERLLFSGQGLTEAQRAQILFINPAGLASGTYDAVFIGDELTPGALIPEPSSLALTAAGLACLVLRRKRNN